MTGSLLPRPALEPIGESDVYKRSQMLLLVKVVKLLNLLFFAQSEPTGIWPCIVSLLGVKVGIFDYFTHTWVVGRTRAKVEQETLGGAYCRW